MPTHVFSAGLQEARKFPVNVSKRFSQARRIIGQLSNILCHSGCNKPNLLSELSKQTFGKEFCRAILSGMDLRRWCRCSCLPVPEMTRCDVQGPQSQMRDYLFLELCGRDTTTTTATLSARNKSFISPCMCVRVGFASHSWSLSPGGSGAVGFARRSLPSGCGQLNSAVMEPAVQAARRNAEPRRFCAEGR